MQFARVHPRAVFLIKIIQNARPTGKLLMDLSARP